MDKLELYDCFYIVQAQSSRTRTENPNNQNNTPHFILSHNIDAIIPSNLLFVPFCRLFEEVLQLAVVDGLEPVKRSQLMKA